MADTPPNVIGLHVSQVPAAIEDVWPVIDGSGVVTAMVLTWDDAQYVRLDHKGEPVNEIGHTHHLMPRRIFQTIELPGEWQIVGARRITREASQIENRLATGGAKMGTFGDREEYEILVKLNAEGCTLVDEIDSNPPFGHIVEMGGVFFLAEYRPGHEPKVESSTAAEEAPASAIAVEDPVTAAPAAELATAGPDAVAAEATADREAAGRAQQKSAANALVEWITEVAAKEAAAEARTPMMVDGKSSLPVEVGDLFVTAAPPKSSPNGASLLKAVVDPLDVDFEPPTHAPAHAPASKAGASLDGPVDERKADASMLVDELRAGDEDDADRAESLARAAAFITGAASGTWAAPEASGGMLTLEQVRKADRFAWDEYMNLYLPHVGFVAAVLKKVPSMGGGPDDVSFVPRGEQDVRPVGWHHLTDCDCPHCEA
jgi:hypothetical protein